MRSVRALLLNIGHVRLLLYQVLTGEVPFGAPWDTKLRHFEVPAAVGKGTRPLRPPHDTQNGHGESIAISDDLWFIITDCWNADPLSRPTAAKLVASVSIRPTTAMISNSNEHFPSLE